MRGVIGIGKVAWKTHGMKRDSVLTSSVIAVLLGIVQGQIFLTGWGYINLYRHQLIGHVDLRLELGASIVMALPVAYALLKLRPEKPWLYLLLAIAPELVWLNLLLVGGPMYFAGSVSLAWLPEIFALPAAAWMIHPWLRKQGIQESAQSGSTAE